MAGRREDAVTGGSETATTSEPASTGTTAARSQLLGALFQAGREISAAAVMFHTALSARLGLTATEEKALDLLDRNGPLTGRQLAERSGLAPASVTSLVDRLEAKGFARRTRNPADGRSVLIETTPDRLANLGPLFADWVRELDELCAKYTDAELAVITDFLTESARRQKDATARLTQPPPAESNVVKLRTTQGARGYPRDNWWLPVVPARAMILETFFFTEILRPMRTQMFRDHASGLP